jgi:hypothetical protein
VIQVDVRALKDLLWDSLVTVNTHKASQLLLALVRSILLMLLCCRLTCAH